MEIKDVPVWIIASIRKAVVERLSGIKIYFDGDDKPTSLPSEYFEIRIDGPTSEKIGSANEYNFRTEINIAIIMTRNENYAFRRQQLIGIAQSALTNSFCITKIGHNSFDGSSVNTLMLISDIIVRDYGKVDPEKEVYVSTVEAHYEMSLP